MGLLVCSLLPRGLCVLGFLGLGWSLPGVMVVDTGHLAHTLTAESRTCKPHVMSLPQASSLELNCTLREQQLEFVNVIWWADALFSPHICGIKECEALLSRGTILSLLETIYFLIVVFSTEMRKRCKKCDLFNFCLSIPSGHSALHLAAKNGHHECVKKLLQVKRQQRLEIMCHF